MTVLTDDMIRACSGSRWRDGIKKCRWCDAQLRGRQRRWCAACVNAWAENHFWTAARKAALRRDRYACQGCGATEELQVHHIRHARGKHTRADCIHHLTNLETLCGPCHRAEHSFVGGHPRLRTMLKEALS